jgi:CheY-like chemotaxis protein
VRHLTELHGGRVWVTSAGPGKGSEFTVELPIVASAAMAETQPETPALARTGPMKRVLVVDDNRDAAETLALLLTHIGHAVDVAHDGASCLELAQRNTPDVALIDIGLPGIDGYEVARQLRRRIGGDVLLVAVTGYGLEADRQRSADAGFDHHLVKPVDIGALERLLAGAAR